MKRSIYQVIFIVATLIYSASCKGYGPATVAASGNIIGTGTGHTGSSNSGGVAERGTGNYGKTLGGGSPHLGGMGSSIGAGGYTAGGIGRHGAGGAGRVGGAGVGQSGITRQVGSTGGTSSFDESPKPYSVGYRSADDQGSVQFKTESADGSGTVKGSYGYRDSQGLYREVDYVADRSRFKANIKTNEPGVGKDSPADVNLLAEQSPSGIQERYAPAAGISGGRAIGGIYGGSGMPGVPASTGYRGTAGEISVGKASGVSGRASRAGHLGSGSGALGGGSELFVGIKKSSSAKSTY